MSQSVRGGADGLEAEGGFDGGEALTILVVDDDSLALNGFRHSLVASGYKVVTASRGAFAVGLVHDCRPDLVLLDVIMPDVDGYEVCRRIREFSAVPIIIVSGLSDPLDRVRGLKAGADDYVGKPYFFEELLARVRALLRRTRAGLAPKNGVSIEYGPLHIDRRAHAVTVRGEPVDLTPMEYKLLLTLAENAERVLDHGELLGTSWGPGYRRDVGYLRVYVRRLRMKLEEDPSRPEYLRTVPGVGYVFGRAEPAPTTGGSVSLDTEWT